MLRPIAEKKNEILAAHLLSELIYSVIKSINSIFDSANLFYRYVE